MAVTFSLIYFQTPSNQLTKLMGSLDGVQTVWDDWNKHRWLFPDGEKSSGFPKNKEGVDEKTRRVSWLAKKLPYVSKYIDQVIVWYGNFRQVLVLIVRVFGENFIKSYQCHAFQARPKWPPKKWTRDVTNLKFWSNVPIANIKLLTRFQVHISTSTQTLTPVMQKLGVVKMSN